MNELGIIVLVWLICVVLVSYGMWAFAKWKWRQSVKKMHKSIESLKETYRKTYKNKGI